MIRKNDWVAYMDGLDKDTCDKIIRLAEEKLEPAGEETYNKHIDN
jgi:hypothetical protein